MVTAMIQINVTLELPGLCPLVFRGFCYEDHSLIPTTGLISGLAQTSPRSKR